MTGHPLDSPLWAALTGPQRHLAEVRGSAAGYRLDVAPFAALRDGPATPDPAAWADLAAIAGPGAIVVLSGAGADPPAGWEVVERIPGLQMDGSGAAALAEPKAVVLGDEDVPEMLDLVARTRPGPFRPSTHLMGTYLGVRDDAGALVAMAGERMHPPGWTEISAVCTDPAYRGHGLAGRLVRAVAAGILDRGDLPFLHVAAVNTSAVRLYLALGFTERRQVLFSALRTPGR